MLAAQTREGDKNNSRPDTGQVQPPALTLPNGGGAVRGIGEKFNANPVTGTGSMSVPKLRWVKLRDLPVISALVSIRQIHHFLA
jgi:hypothetical protein